MTTQFHTYVLLCLYVADPATFLASNSVLGPHFPLRTAGLSVMEKKYTFLSLRYHLISIVNITILSLNFFSL